MTRPSSVPLRACALALRPLPWLIGLGVCGRIALSDPVISGHDEHPHELAALVAEALETRHQLACAQAPLWLFEPTTWWQRLWQRGQMLVPARGRFAVDAAHDVYALELTLTPEGRLLALGPPRNLTSTSHADERALAVQDGRVAWTVGDRESSYRIEMLDFTLSNIPAAWPRLQRWQQRLTNRQQLGHSAGARRRSFRLEPAAERVGISFHQGQLRIEADEGRMDVPIGPLQGARFVRELSVPLAEPSSLVTWAVDRVRRSAFGDERLQWVKALVYRGLDRARLASGSALPGANAETFDLQLDLVGAPKRLFEAPDLNWPPPALEPVLSPAFEAEGEWRALDEDPFVRSNPGLPPSFLTTFIRTDRERKFSSTLVVLWDPRQVELHMRSGTNEPESATGETGDGLIPRQPKVIERLVGAFNGGFQGLHGAFGMAVEGTVYVPPLPFAATVARLEDGSTAFGTWPAVNSENGRIPADVVSFRQNLTPLIAGGVINPYDRLWWGGVPHGWQDDTRTVRSGLCATREGFVAYFYGATVDHEHLARAMLAARCDYALHLDMNQGHTGLEFYRADVAERLPWLPEPLPKGWQTQGEVPELPGYRFRGRRLFKSMQLMHFPRFIRRESRDFFYLTLRQLLPGDDLLPLAHQPERDEGRWRVDGLPQFGFPYAVAVTTLRPDPQRPNTRVRVVKLDPRVLQLQHAADAERTVLSLDPGPGSPHTAPTLALSLPGAGSAAARDAAILLTGTKEPPEAATFAACAGKDELLYFAEVLTDRQGLRDGPLLAQLLKNLGCGEPIFPATAPQLAVAGERGFSGHPVAVGPRTRFLNRVPSAGLRQLFPDTPIIPREEWYGLQQGKAQSP